MEKLSPLLKDIFRHSEYMQRHIPKSANYFCRVLKLMQPVISEEHLTFLKRGAELHDVGKQLGLDILEKPQFTQRESERMQKHPKVGGQFLRRLYGGNHPYVFMAEQHHERWDGKGYFRGLKGDQINWYARIMAIADVMATVTEKRPYDDHVFTMIETGRLLEEEAGKQFDPFMVGRVLNNLENIFK